MLLHIQQKCFSDKAEKEEKGKEEVEGGKEMEEGDKKGGCPPN